jgi:HSP20 family protein
MKAIAKATPKTNGFIPVSFFENFFNSSFPDIWNGNDGWMETMPSANIVEGKDDFKVKLAAPGLEKDDFKIDVDDNVITISAEKETSDKEEKDGKVFRQEYNYSSFCRSFSLPESVDAEKIVANYKNGILTLDLPKKEEKKAKKMKSIAVQA